MVLLGGRVAHVSDAEVARLDLGVEASGDDDALIFDAPDERGVMPLQIIQNTKHINNELLALGHELKA